MRVGVVGASGYAGGELLRLLESHPMLDVEYIAAGSNAGELITDVHSHLIGYSRKRFSETNINEINKCDVIFLALPHGESAKIVGEISSSAKVVDLGADFRLKDPDSWRKYYQIEHAGTWVYGLPELPNKREQISNSNRVANPGCYATAIALAAAPAVQSGAVIAEDIVVVAASGTTGAGRSSKVNLSASEIMNSMSSYKFGGVHQHTPEIEESLQSLSSSKVKLSFNPMLAPMPRGILATVTMKTNLGEGQAREIYSSFYAQEPFVHLLDEKRMPETSSLIGSNAVHLQVAVDSHTSRLLISAAIDNLGKGAAGQALQNANLMCGFQETIGLTSTGIGQ
ncbi:MAG: N-acetyl-gamma-glutamyl-phosphate reductase [Candidatus Nanopelagicaceae bacterium]|nr:N-acetyl-gamma-glutamyl-phosphate reductase [Candidatus Nanopelagicaceae bacterium]